MVVLRGSCSKEGASLRSPRMSSTVTRVVCVFEVISLGVAVRIVAWLLSPSRLPELLCAR